ncbi:GM20129 [Drosophila sechellia]|uniref:GM20129 n=1 Tax=Drosophila sechellia TaxID=7238 RepID=B4HS65_DROSE|nr:GM20129 [Drosophila sechellia]
MSMSIARMQEQEQMHPRLLITKVNWAGSCRCSHVEGSKDEDEDEGVGEADNEDEQLAKSSVASSFAFCT